MQNIKKNSSIFIDDIPEERRKESIEWVKNLEAEFEVMSKAT
jgi:hypothetical protein